ncbi:hypothetical protein WA1_07010 [Scytonema hofmannii PCC 7110]|uniref:Uncharacterized protein n=1 Tax=Scytonema hofmannii PCC 7110 TaxID=128403 RepID=A0A139WT08_9CYAN|nr:hypothetical protein WA1_07010 [Scytonema hofmannii PCC 7110]
MPSFLITVLNTLLEQALTELKKLPLSQQDAMAKKILEDLEELEDENRCDEAFSRSSDALAKLAGIAMARYYAGQTEELDPDSL